MATVNPYRDQHGCLDQKLIERAKHWWQNVCTNAEKSQYSIWVLLAEFVEFEHLQKELKK